MVVGDVFIESNLLSSLSIFPRTQSLSTTGEDGWSVGPEAVSFSQLPEESVELCWRVGGLEG